MEEKVQTHWLCVYSTITVKLGVIVMPTGMLFLICIKMAVMQIVTSEVRTCYCCSSCTCDRLNLCFKLIIPTHLAEKGVFLKLFTNNISQ